MVGDGVRHTWGSGMTQRSPFAELLQHHRAVAGLTQERLAERAGLSVRAISDLERGVKLAPRQETLRLLAEALALSPAEWADFVAAARGPRRAAGIAGPASPADDPGPSSLDRLPLVGRATEAQRLTARIDAAAAGQGGLVLIEGEAGIGKSRLIQEALAAADRRGLGTLLVGCYQVEQAMPYHPVIDLVHQVLDGWPAALTAGVPAPALAELAALVPAVAARHAAMPDLAVSAPEARQARLFQALLHLIDAVATAARPLLLAVDDLHWADPATLAFLHHLARHARARPLLLLYAYRGEEAATDAGLATLIQNLRREPAALHLPLHRLSTDDTATLLAALADPTLPAPALGPWLHRETDGNPFFLVSILHSLREGGLLPTEGPAAWQVEPAQLTGAGPALTVPEALREAVRLRLGRLSPPARSLLDIVAVLGRRFDVATLQAVTGDDEAGLLDRLDDLVRRRLLDDEGDGRHLDFCHDKIREVVYSDLASPRRALLHRQVAATLEGLTGPDTIGRAAALAEHYERGQSWPKAIAYLAAAADGARHLFAMRAALDYYDRAISLAEAHTDLDADGDTRLRLIERRGEARAQASEFAGAIDDLQRVLATARDRGDSAREREVLITLGMIYRRVDAYGLARTCLDQALAVSRAAGDARHVADTLYHLGTVAWGAGDNHQALASHAEAVAICQSLGLTDLIAVQAYHGRGEAFVTAAQPRQAIADFTESLQLARRLGDRAYEAENLQMLGWASLGPFGLGDYAEGRRLLHESLAICQAHGLDWHSLATLIGLAHATGATGDYTAGLEFARQARAAAEAIGAARFVTFALDAEGDIWRDLGDLARAREAHQRGLDLAGQSDVAFWVPRLRANLAIDRLRGGDDAVDDELAGALAAARAGNLTWHVGRCLEGVAEAALARGQTAAVLAAADELLHTGTANGLREWVAHAQRWRGAALLRSGEQLAAGEALRQGLALAEVVGRERLIADLQAELAAWEAAPNAGAWSDRRAPTDLNATSN
jgi:transcriptional regulator with XRE-family HTH domain/tetratricopeptide (TPR) repeat protein